MLTSKTWLCRAESDVAGELIEAQVKESSEEGCG